MSVLTRVKLYLESIDSLCGHFPSTQNHLKIVENTQKLKVFVNVTYMHTVSHKSRQKHLVHSVCDHCTILLPTNQLLSNFQIIKLYIRPNKIKYWFINYLWSNPCLLNRIKLIFAFLPQGKPLIRISIVIHFKHKTLKRESPFFGLGIWVIFRVYFRQALKSMDSTFQNSRTLHIKFHGIWILPKSTIVLGTSPKKWECTLDLKEGWYPHTMHIPIWLS